MEHCNRHKWVAVPGTERDWPIKNTNGTRIIRHDRYQEFKCPKCGHTSYRPAKGGAV